MKKKNGITAVICLVLILALAAAFAVSRYILIGGEIFRKDSELLDLRHQALTEEGYLDLTEKLPDSRILWNVPFQGRTYTSDISGLTVNELTPEDARMLEYFDRLEELDATGCEALDQVISYRDAHPDCRVSYRITLGDRVFGHDTASLELQDADGEELLEKLALLPDLTEVALKGKLPEPEALQTLQESYPAVEFHWELTFGGKKLTDQTRELDLSGVTVTYAEAARAISYLPELTHADMRGCGLTDQELMSLADSAPDCFFLWEMTFGEFTLSTDAEEIDISGMQLESVEPVESLLPYFPKLTKVVMCKCGIDDETMDALNKRHEAVRFVWSVRIKYVDVRTDATWFYPFKFDRDMTVNNKDLYPLRYCQDMVCIDIGHMVEVTDCEWAAFMPNLKYFIIGETAISDLSPLSGLKNLEYLEMFTIPVTDYSPLLGCTGMRDLNLGKTYAPAAPIAQMTWLENLWWCDCATKGNPCSDAPEILPEALPNTTLKLYGAHPTAAGWRQLPNYFAMRDFMGMFYLT